MTRKGYILCGLAALLIAGWFAGLSAFVKDSAHIRPAEPLKKLDAIVVLTGGSNRVDTGFDLLEKGAGKKLFISGVYRGTEIKKLLNHWKRETQDNLDCCVELGFDADNTAGNAAETVAWLRKENFRSIYMVTSNYHIKRAMLEFGAMDPGLKIVPFPVVPDNIDITGWWRNPSARSLILREYMKYLAVCIQYKVLRR